MRNNPLADVPVGLSQRTGDANDQTRVRNAYDRVLESWREAARQYEATGQEAP